jgi:hypothetical protein
VCPARGPGLPGGSPWEAGVTIQQSPSGTPPQLPALASQVWGYSDRASGFLASLPGGLQAKLEVIVHRLARYGVYFVVGVMLLVWLLDLSLTHSVEEVQPHSRTTVRLAEQQCNQHIGPFAKQDTAWSRWREARGQGHAVSAGIDTCYDASGTKAYCFSILSC